MPFDITQFPNAYFSENVEACKLRKNLKKNVINVPKIDYEIVKKNFLSNQNINNINLKLIEIVKNEINVKIPLQKPIEIFVFAKYIYKQYALDQAYNYKNQLDYLNDKLINYIKPKLFQSIKDKVEYIKKLESKDRCFLPLPLNVNKLPKYNESLSNKIFFK